MAQLARGLLRGLVVVTLITCLIRCCHAKKQQEFRRCEAQLDDEDKRYSSTEVFGDGVQETVSLNQSQCFMISPRNRNGERLDQFCQPPSTSWVVILQSLDNMVRLRASLMHLVHEGYHMACYQLMEPGDYKISVLLTGLDYSASLESRNLGKERFPVELVKEVTVSAQPQNRKYEALMRKHEESLPLCTWKLLGGWHGTEGRWIGNYWHPYICRMHRITPEEARSCLKGKAVLMVGDTQQLAQYATTMAFLSSTDESHFLETLEGSSNVLPSLRFDKTRVNGSVPYLPGPEGELNVGVHHTEFANDVTVKYYGTATNGFAVGRIPQLEHGAAKSSREKRKGRGMGRGRGKRSRAGRSLQEDSRRGHGRSRRGKSRRGHRSEASLGLLDARPNILDGVTLSKERLDTTLEEAEARKRGDATLVFVAHTKASDPIFREWMVDPRRKGPLVYDYAPFDYVLASSGVHDLFAFGSVANYSEKLETEYIPSLRLAVRSKMHDAITWMGAWSILQSSLPEAKLAAASNARAFGFDRATRKAVRTWGIPFLDAEPLTQSRPDLSIGPAHYSWPVARAVLQQWLGSICFKPEEAEP